MYYILTIKVIALWAYYFTRQCLVAKRECRLYTKKAIGLIYMLFNKTTKGGLIASSIPSYVLGGGITPVPENDVPYRVSQRPVEIC